MSRRRGRSTSRQRVEETEEWWLTWSSRRRPLGQWDDAIERSLVVLKGLTYAPSGGIVAAATTSLPEAIGGPRNWDYRYCWLRDATFSLLSLMGAGYTDEARAWRDWLLRAVAGKPEQAQIMYGPTGKHRLTEEVLDWLPGYEGSRPVRVGNAAHGQFQLDVYGEVLDALHQARVFGIDSRRELAARDRPRCRSSRTRGPSPMTASGRCAAAVSGSPTAGSWRGSPSIGRCARPSGSGSRRHSNDGGRYATRSTPTCSPRASMPRACSCSPMAPTRSTPASSLVPIVGFLPASDERVVRTVEAIQRELTVDGFVRRYLPEESNDGLPGDEGVFLMCTFWLADNLALLGRLDEARALFERLLVRCATTSGCWPRSTTRPRSGCSATSRRRSPTSPW